MVKIFSGDDTDFKGDQRLALTFAAPDVDFTGCTAEIEFLGQRRTFAQVTNGGRLVFSFSADETRGMRCGVWPVTIRLRDASGRVRTVDNTQRIKVTNDVNEAYADTEQEISVALRSGGVAMPEIPASLDVDSADSVGQFKAKFNLLLGLLRNVAAIAVAVLLPFAANAASVATAPINNIPGTASVVTNVTFDGLLTEHQDISGKADKADTYTKSETDAKIVELAPVPGNYAIVSNSAMGAVQPSDFKIPSAFGEWDLQYSTSSFSVASGPYIVEDEDGRSWQASGSRRPNFAGRPWQSCTYEMIDYIPREWDVSVATGISFVVYGMIHLLDEDESAETLAEGNLMAFRVPLAYTNRFGVASEDSVAQTITNTVTKAYVEDLGIESGIQVESDPVWDAAKGEYATTGTVAQVSEAVGTLWSYVYGDSVWIAVTNYMRTIGGVSPSFQLWEVRNGATNLVYWSKEEITNVTHDLIYDCKTNLEQTVRNAVAEMPDKAWSKYQSATGNEAPDGVTIVSTPTIQLTGGGEWYRYVDVSSNSVWFLKSNGLHTFGGDTNGYFRILDDEGNATFEVRKTDSYLVDAVASSVHFDENGNFCVSFESNIEPVIYTTASLENPNFLPQGDDPNVTVTWTQSGGTYTATLEQTVKGPSLFAYAKVEVQGETVIRNSVPTDMQGGIVVNGVKYNVGTATINGNTVLTLTPRN